MIIRFCVLALVGWTVGVLGADLKESDVPKAILDHFKKNFTEEPAAWSSEGSTCTANYTKNDSYGVEKLGLRVVYDSRTGQVLEARSFVGSPDLVQDRELLEMTLDQEARAGVLADMKKRAAKKDFVSFMMLNWDGMTPEAPYSLSLHVGERQVVVTYDGKGRVKMEEEVSGK